MLGKIASAGQNGQFRTPRHIIQLMVEMVQPKPEDVICDPAAGTCGFLVAAGEYLRTHHPELFRNEKQRRHFHESLFHGFDFDSTMLRIGAMNMTLHGVENADVTYRDSLAQDHMADAGTYSLVLANPPFAGSLDYESTAKDLQKIIKTKKTELLFLALFLRLLKTGGRAAVIVPDGVLSGQSSAHKQIRRILVEDNQLHGIIKMPSGVFRPYSNVSTAILVFTKTGVGGTDQVWFYDMRADGYSLDDKRQPLVEREKRGCRPSKKLSEEEFSKNDLPHILARWSEREIGELSRKWTEQSFCVSVDEIRKSRIFDLSYNRYVEVPMTERIEGNLQKILGKLSTLEEDIAACYKKVRESLQ
jgi:type I restriction enzyme M protein